MCKKRMQCPQIMASQVVFVTHQESYNEEFPHTKNIQQPKIIINGVIFMGSVDTLIICI